MGFYIRKSVRVGPFRFNLSKSGIGVSAGIKGLRIGTGPRGNYVHMGMGGFYYRQTLPSPTVLRHQAEDPSGSNEFAATATHGPMQSITSASTSLMRDSTSAGLLNELEEKRKRIPRWPFALVISVLIVASVVIGKASFWIVIPIGVLSTALFAISILYDLLTKSVVVMYDLDDRARETYEQLHHAVTAFGQCGATWHIDAEGRVYNRKYHAGASTLVSKKRIVVDEQSPPYVKSNITPLRIPVGARFLYLFPDRILIYGADGVGAVGYDDLRFSIDSTQFIEDGVLPHDAKIVDRTWRYVNKDGGPDRRFNNNRELPICLYEEIHVTSPSGLNEVLQVSRLGLGMNLEKSARALAAMINVAHAAEIERRRAEEARHREPQKDATVISTTHHDSRTRAPTSEEMCAALLQILCCVMVADGRVSRAERGRIKEIMTKAKAPYTSDVVEERIDLFIEQVRLHGFRDVFSKALLVVPLFKQIGKAEVLSRCIDSVAGANGQIEERERQLCDRIRQMLA